MLTGDKLETAENIATSCSLIKEDMEIYRIRNIDDTIQVCSENFVKKHRERIEAGERCAIVFEGA
jgi:magnesium-transporting ATPase (P-type)